jgi:hypothetical protein
MSRIVRTDNITSLSVFMKLINELNFKEIEEAEKRAYEQSGGKILPRTACELMLEVGRLFNDVWYKCNQTNFTERIAIRCRVFSVEFNPIIGDDAGWSSANFIIAYIPQVSVFYLDDKEQ